MSYPTKYERLYDYVSYQNTNPNRPLPATRVHADLNAVALSTDEIVEFLKGFTRSDGALANESVGIDQLETSVAAMIGDTTAVDDLVEASEAAVAAAVAADASADSASTSASNAAASASASATSASAAATSESNAAATLADAVVGAASSVDDEVMLFDGTTGKASKRASFSGLLKAASGVLAAATALTDYFVTSKGSDIASAAHVELADGDGRSDRRHRHDDGDSDHVVRRPDADGSGRRNFQIHEWRLAGNARRVGHHHSRRGFQYVPRVCRWRRSLR